MYAYGAIAGLQLAGGYFASQNIKEAARINKDIADMNAEFAELDAYDAKLEGETQKAKFQTGVDQVLSAQKAAFTAADVDISFGTASSILEETEFLAELNRMEIEQEAEEVALGFKREARGIRLSSTMEFGREMTRAGDVFFQSFLAAANTGLTGYSRTQS